MSKEKAFKSYRVDFTYSVEEQASMYIVAPSVAEAEEGALQILKQSKTVRSPKVVNVADIEEENETATEAVTYN